MGMDLILGAIILVATLRGWFKGFFAQAIRLGGAVGGVYLAGPLRDLARPIAAERLTSMAPDLLDRILWWVAAFGSFVVLSGTATGLLMAYKRRRARERQAEGLVVPQHRGDQSAGALLGAAKGAVVVAFLVAGIQRYAPDYLKAGGWAGEQVQTSHLLAWSEQYQPARRIWEAEPVRAFVSHVRSQGLGPGAGSGEGAETDEPKAVAVEDRPAEAQARARGRRPSPLAVEPSRPGPKSGEADLDAALEEVRRDLERLDSLRGLIPE